MGNVGAPSRVEHRGGAFSLDVFQEHLCSKEHFNCDIHRKHEARRKRLERISLVLYSVEYFNSAIYSNLRRVFSYEFIHSISYK